MPSYLANRREPWVFPVRLVLAVAIFLVALALRLLILPIDAGMTFITFFPAMVLCFYLCGILPGFAMAALSAFAGAYIFIKPFWSYKTTPNAIIGVVAFLISAALIGFLVRRLQTNIHDSRTNEASLRIAEARYHAILEDQTELISRYLPDGTITFVNQAFCQFFGKHIHDLLGKIWAPMAHPDDVLAITLELSKLTPTNPIVAVENRVIGADGRVHWCRFINRAFFDEGGNLVETQSVGRDVTERRELEEQVMQMALHDPLTQLPNRRLFKDRLQKAVAANLRSARHGALLYLDLDNFKPLNDARGHDAGDLLLKEVAGRLLSSVRDMDTVARIGGDEFIVMISDLDGTPAQLAESAGALAEKIRLEIGKPYSIHLEGQDHSTLVLKHVCTASIGVVVFPRNDGNADEYIQMADKAMFEAKAAGRNTVRVFQPEA